MLPVAADVQPVAAGVQPVAVDVQHVAVEVISPVVTPSLRAEFLLFDMLVLPPHNVAARAAHLVREQHYIEESMKRLAEQGLGRNAAGTEAGRLLFERKEAMHDEIADLEQEILRLSREAQGEASTRSRTSSRSRRSSSMEGPG